VNSVMAGCKPEYLPVVLAIAESGCQVETQGSWSQWQVVSGPIAKEIGMNDGAGAFNPEIMQMLRLAVPFSSWQ